MRMSYIVILISAACLGGVFPEQSRAENILIDNSGTKWRSGGNVSSPLIVQAKAGDVIEIKVTGPHGFVTIDKPGNQSPSEALKFVIACGEDPQTKPDAVFREVECSRLNKVLSASMKLEVLDKLQSDVHFWCIVHQDDMWGTIKRRP